MVNKDYQKLCQFFGHPVYTTWSKIGDLCVWLSTSVKHRQRPNHFVSFLVHFNNAVSFWTRPLGLFSSTL